MHAIQVKRTGGLEALEYVEIDRPQPKNDEALVRLLKRSARALADRGDRPD